MLLPAGDGITAAHLRGAGSSTEGYAELWPRIGKGKTFQKSWSIGCPGAWPPKPTPQKEHRGSGWPNVGFWTEVSRDLPVPPRFRPGRPSRAGVVLGIACSKGNFPPARHADRLVTARSGAMAICLC